MGSPLRWTLQQSRLRKAAQLGRLLTTNPKPRLSCCLMLDYLLPALLRMTVVCWEKQTQEKGMHAPCSLLLVPAGT